ncbi:response regulator transcription factor [Aliiglaciecola sp. CAU 1673]|uniref:response regulator transcription factor n=1 Tax=Aliiglaciecola sp. CAU 1673 TaxID=3032595 RepID=UPI0023DC3F26|nr:response regulator transcription factor [Aliiglaciecola sp. CAU 1673]MDF2179280.1 response regulator transcription factor [Aliiglaciecola sp. CAU 1673]
MRIYQSRRVLYVEDDINSAEILTLYLKQQGLDVQHYDNAQDATRALNNLNWDIAIFDIMLPGGDGRQLLHKAVELNIPTIMVTAKVSESDRLQGFDAGADDYVCKPYSPRELTSRVLALLKRTRVGHQKDRLQFTDLTINPNSHCAEISGQDLALTSAEFSLLMAFASQPGKVLSRKELLDTLYKHDEAVTERTIDTHMVNLRKKLGDNKHSPKYIVTRYGQGYQFVGRRSI